MDASSFPPCMHPSHLTSPHSLLPHTPSTSHPCTPHTPHLHTPSHLMPPHIPHPSLSLTPHILSHPTPLTPPHTSPPHTSHSTPLTECIRRRHNHCHGPRTPPSSTTSRRQPRVGPHPKPREGHCRKLKEPRIYPQGKLNYRNLLPVSHIHWCPLVARLCLVPPTHTPFRNLHSQISVPAPMILSVDNIIGAGTLI